MTRSGFRESGVVHAAVIVDLHGAMYHNARPVLAQAHLASYAVAEPECGLLSEPPCEGRWPRAGQPTG